EETRPLPEGKLYQPVAWSPDSRYLTIVDIHSNTDVDILVLDTQTGEQFQATQHEGEILFIPGPWAPDSKGFYMATNQGREYVGLAFYELAPRSWKWVETPDFDIEQMEVSKNGEILIWSVNDGGRSRLRGRNLRTNQMLNLPDLPISVISAVDLSPDGTRLALIMVTPGEASNLYEYTLATGELEPLGQSMLGGVDPADMIDPEIITYPTHDGRMIPAWLYRPKGVGKFPVVLSIHGGPEAQERANYNYNGFYQY